MKNKFKLLFIIIIFLIIDTDIVSALNFNKFDYYIDKYHVEIKVNEDNSLDIIEEIDAYFNEQRHGIIRSIPIINKITRLDGSVERKKANITNLETNQEYSKTINFDMFDIKLGDPNLLVIGKQKYILKYNYDLGKDILKNIDEFYFNIIGTDWDVPIKNITFNISFPKEFDKSKLGFSSGKKGSISNDKVIYKIDENKIIGSYNGYLDEYEGITIRLELEDGYFVNNMKNLSIFIYIIPILCLTLSYIIWRKYGKEYPVIETVEFYPPDGMNSIDVALWYKGEIDEKDTVSLLIYLANKGYLSIDENNGNTIITKLKEYDGTNIYEKQFIDNLFKNEDINREIRKTKYINAMRNFANKLNKVVTNTDENILEEIEINENIDNNKITLDRLKYKMYDVSSKIVRDINRENYDKIYNVNSKKKSKNILSLMIITFLTIMFVPALVCFSKIDLIIFLGLMLFNLLFFKSTFKIGGIGNYISFILIYIILFVITILINPSFTIIFNDNFYLYGFIIGWISIFTMNYFKRNMFRRTKVGIDILGKIKGFKNFLETVEKDRLDMLVMENPNYFYDILPYTYVLDISDKWINKFENIVISKPDWYLSNNDFDVVSFSNSIDRTVNITYMGIRDSIKRENSYSSSSSSSRGSGGGSSGGGSGGGGGRSW